MDSESLRARKGFPPGDVGRLLALMHEIDHNGLKELLTPLRNSPPQRQRTTPR